MDGAQRQDTLPPGHSESECRPTPTFRTLSDHPRGAVVLTNHDVHWQLREQGPDGGEGL